MGTELHRHFPFIDVVCSGEADHIFPEVVRRVRAGEPLFDLGGVTCRVHGETVTSSTPQKFVSNLDDLPYPDHGDYFRAFQSSTASSVIVPEMTMETSRGCWWGQKHHCTFCGLNGLSMTFRSKSADRAYSEIKHLLSTYGDYSIFNTDNIVDIRYFNELFPRIVADGVKMQLFYETKSNLKKGQLLTFRNVGSREFQPGIESLNSHVLTLMDKGVKGIQNVQLLRWAAEMEFNVSWNIICGFPVNNLRTTGRSCAGYALCRTCSLRCMSRVFGSTASAPCSRIRQSMALRTSAVRLHTASAIRFQRSLCSSLLSIWIVIPRYCRKPWKKSQLSGPLWGNGRIFTPAAVSRQR